MSRRVGDQEWSHRGDRIVIRNGSLVGRSTWLLSMIISTDPLQYEVQKIQHKYGFYPFDWTRTRCLIRRKVDGSVSVEGG